MKARSKEFDLVWDEHKTPMDNISTIFTKTDFVPSVTTASTGFYSARHNEEREEYNSISDMVTNFVKYNENVSMENLYQFLFMILSLKNFKHPQRLFLKKLDYVVQRMEEVNPELKNQQGEIENMSKLFNAGR